MKNKNKDYWTAYKHYNCAEKRYENIPVHDLMVFWIQTKQYNFAEKWSERWTWMLIKTTRKITRIRINTWWKDSWKASEIQGWTSLSEIKNSDADKFMNKGVTHYSFSVPSDAKLQWNES